MPRVIITVGIPASGKTTWANKYAANNDNVEITCRDDIRSKFGYPYGDPDVEERITALQRLHIRDAIWSGANIIVADTNIVNGFRTDLIEYCLDMGATVQIKTFPIDLMEAVKRDAWRPNSVGFQTVARFEQMYYENQGYFSDCVLSRSTEGGYSNFSVDNDTID